ncbi:MAG: hypothetical protein GJ676_04540 [Rhodobacteraceae bacterium]|nr:hypothetical protein [Paracoccaceae bacterium]
MVIPDNSEPGPLPSGSFVLCLVIGVAFGLGMSWCAILMVWVVAPFFAPLLLGLLVVGTLIAGIAAGRVNWPYLSAWQILLLATVLWSASIAVPYTALVGELYLRVSVPPVPDDAVAPKTRARPLSGGTTFGPAPGFVVEYTTVLPPAEARAAVQDALPDHMSLQIQNGYLYAVPSRTEIQALFTATETGTHVKLGHFKAYSSALPVLMLLANWAGILLMALWPKLRKARN